MNPGRDAGEARGSRSQERLDDLDEERTNRRPRAYKRLTHGALDAHVEDLNELQRITSQTGEPTYCRGLRCPLLAAGDALHRLPRAPKMSCYERREDCEDGAAASACEEPNLHDYRRPAGISLAENPFPEAVSVIPVARAVEAMLRTVAVRIEEALAMLLEVENVLSDDGPALDTSQQPSIP